jgi:hypothetical protein
MKITYFYFVAPRSCNRRCAACGSREASMRIVYTGAGGYHYSVSPRSAD